MTWLALAAWPLDLLIWRHFWQFSYTQRYCKIYSIKCSWSEDLAVDLERASMDLCRKLVRQASTTSWSSFYLHFDADFSCLWTDFHSSISIYYWHKVRVQSQLSSACVNISLYTGLSLYFEVTCWLGYWPPSDSSFGSLIGGAGSWLLEVAYLWPGCFLCSCAS